MRKPTICICENKATDQLRSNCEADQRLCFRFTDSTIPPSLLSKSEISSLAIHACTARFVSDLVENHIVDFLMTRLICILADGEFSDWSRWSDCFCDGIAEGSSGARTRTRQCENVANGGDFCSGPLEENEPCDGECA